MLSMFRSDSRPARTISAVLTLAMVLQLVSPATYALAEEAVASEDVYEEPVGAEESGEQVGETVDEADAPEEAVGDESVSATEDAVADENPAPEPVALGAPEDAPEPEAADQPEAPADPSEQFDVFVREVPTEEATYDDVAPDEDLVAGYIEQQFSQELPDAADEPQRLSNAAQYLTGNDAIVYGLLKDMIAEVAAGTRTSTVFEIPATALTGGKTSWTAAELGVSTLVSNGRITSEAQTAFSKLISFNQHKVILALLSDCPYDLYWFDKNKGSYYSGLSYSSDGSTMYFSSNASLSLYLYVSSDYASGTYSVDPSYGTRVRTAVAKAKSIVSANAGKSVYDRLVAYRDAICELVSYNSSAANNSGTPYGDPWQLVNVFDGDSSTNVVCEGYSKAFKYLCDLSNFSNVECRLVTGTMNGGTGAGDHMWNVVTMPDGKNYMVDVTNSDSGTIGQNGGLFITPYTSGDVNSQYTFTAGGRSIIYAYEDPDMYLTWSEADLTLSSTPYDPANDIKLISIAGATVTVSDQTYTGFALTPAVTVRVNGTTLTKNVDYTVSYSNNTNAGTATVTITGIGNYTDTKTTSFTINKAKVTPPTARTGLTYTGSSQTGVAAGTGYSLSGTTSATNAGSYTATARLSDTANYMWSDGSTGVKSIAWTIAKAKVTPPTARTGLTYTGSGQAGVAVGAGYGLSGTTSATNAGSYTATASLNDTANYMWSDGTTANKSIAWSIARASISSATVSSIPAQTYTGSALRPEPAVTWGGRTLAKGTDYTLSYSSNTAVGTATVTVTGAGNFTGTKGATFSIVAAAKPSVASATVTGVTNRTYDGSAQTQSPTVSLNGKTLARGTDYTLSYKNNTNAGTATVTITGTGSYTGTKSVTFTIAKAKVAIPKAATGLTYTGSSQRGVATGTGYGLSGTTSATNAGSYSATASLSDTANYAWSDGTTANKTIAWSIAKAKVAIPTAATGLTYNGSSQRGVSGGTGYSLSGTYSATDAGSYTATARLSDTANYAWSDGTSAAKSIGWSIAKANIGAATVAGIPAQTHTGSALTPEPTVTWNGTTLKKGTDYTLSYSNNTAVGTATVTVTGAGNFTGTKTTTFSITAAPKKDISSATVSSIAARTYDGSAQTPEPTVAYGGATLKKGTDYTLSYSNNTNAGTATITITGTGDYTGTKDVTFTINRKKIAIPASKTLTYTGGIQSAYSGNSDYSTAGTSGATHSGTYSTTLILIDKTNTSWSDGTTANKTISWTIAQAKIEDTVISAIPAQTYNGSALKPTVVVKYNGTQITTSAGYTVAYSNNTNAGTATVTITGKNDFAGTKTATFTINKLAITVPKAKTGLVYTGSSQSGVDAGEGYRLSGTTGATSVGTYTTSAYLDDTANLVWSDGTSSTKSISWSISKASISSASVSAIPTQVYTGSALRPVPTLTWNGRTLRQGNDYTLAYKNNTDPGTATITFTGTGNFTGTMTASFAISKTDPSKIDIAGSGVAVTSGTYDGTPKTPLVTVTKNGKTLKQGTDYTLTYTNNINAGRNATVIITGIGDYTGSMTTTFTINKADVTPPTAKSGLVYNGSSQRGVPTGANYTLSGTATATNAGTYTATARLNDKNNYCWYDGSTTDKSIAWTIAKAKVTPPTARTGLTYTGSGQAGVAVGAGYGLSGTTSATNAGSYTATASLNDTANYMWSDGTTANKSIAWSIARASISSATVASIPAQTYTGSALRPEPTVAWNGRTLAKGTDYTLSYSSNTNVGTATVTITGAGNFTGTKTATFSIVAAAKPSVASATVTGVTNRTYDGSAQTQSPTVSLNGKTLARGTDYTLSYSNNTNAGTATMTVTGTGGYAGTKSVTFTIAKAKVAIPTAATGLTYTGSSQRGVSGGTGYSLSGTYSATDAGSYTATARLSDDANHTWSDGTTAAKSIGWSIAPANISGATIAKIADQTHTGSALKPEPKVTWNGTTLKRGTDYTVAYKDNTVVGTATVTVTGRGNFTGTKTTTFKIAAAPTPAAKHVAVYRLYNHKTSEHLYTTSANEYRQLPIITKGDWRQENIAWYAPDGAGEPVYRLYNKAMGDHYYSKSKAEIAVLTSRYGWTVDNNGAPAFWSALKDDEGAMPLYCLYNSKLKKGQHHFTADENERNVLVEKAGWRYEKVAFYGYPATK